MHPLGNNSIIPSHFVKDFVNAKKKALATIYQAYMYPILYRQLHWLPPEKILQTTASMQEKGSHKR